MKTIETSIILFDQLLSRLVFLENQLKLVGAICMKLSCGVRVMQISLLINMKAF